MPALLQFEKYLDKIIGEIQSFPSDDSIWQVPPGIANSAGNLGLHIAGNLLHFIGAVMGNTGYVRTREREFNDKGLTCAEVVQQLMRAKETVQQVLGASDRLSGTDDYTELFQGNRVSVNEVLAHLLAHLAYHTGQINYLRRLQYPA